MYEENELNPAQTVRRWVDHGASSDWLPLV